MFLTILRGTDFYCPSYDTQHTLREHFIDKDSESQRSQVAGSGHKAS